MSIKPAFSPIQTNTNIYHTISNDPTIEKRLRPNSVSKIKNLNTVSIHNIEECLYSDRLKLKISEQAKRLTKLAQEKEELLELLKEKTSTINSSFSTCTPNILMGQLTKNNSIPTIPFQPNTYYEWEKVKQELTKTLEKNKEWNSEKKSFKKFKESITERWKHANEDIEKTKVSVTQLTQEKEQLISQIKENEETISKFRDERSGFMLSKSQYESQINTLQKENCELHIQLNQANKVQISRDAQWKDLNKLKLKNKNWFHDNKELVLQLRSIQNENQKWKSSNTSFSNRIDRLTDQLNAFQLNINNTLKQSLSMTNLENEKLKQEYSSALAMKEWEISKLKDWNNNFMTAEKDLKYSLEENKEIIEKLKKENKQLKEEIQTWKNENQKVCTRSSSWIKELNKIKKCNDLMNIETSNTNKTKNIQITNMKNYTRVLEDKLNTLGKNKKYLEHLLTCTHPWRDTIKRILELYNEIVQLEIQKRILKMITFEARKAVKMRQIYNWSRRREIISKSR